MKDPGSRRRQQKFDEIKHTLRNAEGAFEVVVLTVMYYFVWRYSYGVPSEGGFAQNRKWLLMAIYIFLALVLLRYCDSFEFGHLKLTDIVVSQWIALAIVNIVTYLQLCLMANHMLTLIPIIVLTGADVAVSFLLSYLYTAIYHHFSVPKHMLMIYGTRDALTLKFKMETRNDKYKIAKTICCEDSSYTEIVNEIPGYDAVVINDVDAKIRNDLLKYCYKHSVRTYLVPKISDIIYSGSDDITLFDTPLKLVRGKGLSPAQRFVKRAFDLILCTIALLPALPVMLIVALAIKIDDGGSVFYRQERVTKDGKIFEILKFRSMTQDAESDGKAHPATDNDPRITRVGKVIRSLRIDELPQIFNILKGDMSIVGPRPERVEHCEKYSAQIPEFEFRNKVKGGLTGFAQIYGKYNTSALDKLRLDLMYIENYSVLLDIKLILMTIRIMFKKESTEGFAENPPREHSDIPEQGSKQGETNGI